LAITDENAVLILGAGASFPHNLPLGGSLIGDIYEQIQQEYNRLVRNEGGIVERWGFQEPYRASEHSKDFDNFPILGSLFILHPLKDNRASDGYKKEVKRILELGDLLLCSLGKTLYICDIFSAFICISFYRHSSSFETHSW